MDKPSSEIVQFASKQKRGELEPIDQAGQALIGLLKKQRTSLETTSSVQ
jgi:hypothetical protein